MAHVNPFLAECRLGLRRLLSSANRNLYAPTHGSFDRPFWHYRAVTGFPSATFAQGVLPLALAWRYPLFGEEYSGSPAILHLAEAGMRHWASLQHADGSFDEWYPFERSHVATAFTAEAISEALVVLGDAVEAETRRVTVAALVKAAEWLSEHMDDKVLNHTAGAVPALENIILLSGADLLRQGLEKNLALMQDKQSSEGWFQENGGFDAGYLSLSIDYLWKFFEKTGDGRAKAMVEKGLDFLDGLVHPDGSSGGEYTSRNTKYLMPRGLVAAAPALPKAAQILSRYLSSVEAGRAVTPSSTDDRYMIFFFLPNWMQAAIEYEERFVEKWVAPPDGTRPVRCFPKGGLIVTSGEGYRLVMNARKAGTFKLFVEQDGSWRRALEDNGFFLRGADGVPLSTQYLLEPGELRLLRLDEKTGEGKVELAMALRKVNYTLPLRNYQLPFLLYSGTLGRLPAMNTFFEKTIKNIFIRKPAVSEARLERVIVIKGGEMTIEDKLEGTKGEFELIEGDISTAPHVPSSRYFVRSDLEAPMRRSRITLPWRRVQRIDLKTGAVVVESP